MWTHRYLFYSVDLNAFLYLSWCSNCPRFGQWDPFEAGSCVLLMHLYYSLSTSSPSGTRCYRLIFLWLSLGNCHFFRSPGSLGWKMIFCDPRSGCWLCSWLPLGCQQAKLCEIMCVCVYLRHCIIACGRWLLYWTVQLWRVMTCFTSHRC